jgi:hypothetical protein
VLALSPGVIIPLPLSIFAIKKARGGFDTQDSEAAIFAVLPIADMYPALFPASSVLAAEPVPTKSCVNATDDTSNGYLQAGPFELVSHSADTTYTVRPYCISRV